jgi:uncharacterized membrane protein
MLQQRHKAYEKKLLLIVAVSIVVMYISIYLHNDENDDNNDNDDINDDDSI